MNSLKIFAERYSRLSAAELNRIEQLGGGAKPAGLQEQLKLLDEDKAEQKIHEQARLNYMVLTHWCDYLYGISDRKPITSNDIDDNTGRQEE